MLPKRVLRHSFSTRQEESSSKATYIARASEVIGAEHEYPSREEALLSWRRLLCPQLCCVGATKANEIRVYDSRIVPQLRQPSSIDVPILGTQRLAQYE